MGFKKKCVIFDMDGCLVDTERAYIKAWAEAFQREGIPIDLSVIKTFTGRSYKQINREVEKYTGSHSKMTVLRGIREDVFWEDLDKDEINLMPGAIEILKYVKASGTALGIASSTVSSKAERILRHFNLYELFDFRVFGDMIENAKPSPDIYYKACEASGVLKEECITFEDSVSGVKAANAAGVDVIYAPDLGARISENEKVFAEVSSLIEGKVILEGILWR